MSQAPRGADLLFTELADAVRYSQDWKRSVDEQEAMRRRVQKQLSALDDLSARISKAFDGLYLDPADSEGLSRKITEFSSLSVQQARERVVRKQASTLSPTAIGMFPPSFVGLLDWSMPTKRTT